MVSIMSSIGPVIKRFGLDAPSAAESTPAGGAAGLHAHGASSLPLTGELDGSGAGSGAVDAEGSGDPGRFRRARELMASPPLAVPRAVELASVHRSLQSADGGMFSSGGRAGAAVGAESLLAGHADGGGVEAAGALTASGLGGHASSIQSPGAQSVVRVHFDYDGGDADLSQGQDGLAGSAAAGSHINAADPASYGQPAGTSSSGTATHSASRSAGSWEADSLISRRPTHARDKLVSLLLGSKSEAADFPSATLPSAAPAHGTGWASEPRPSGSNDGTAASGGAHGDRPSGNGALSAEGGPATAAAGPWPGPDSSSSSAVHREDRVPLLSAGSPDDRSGGGGGAFAMTATDIASCVDVSPAESPSSQPSSARFGSSALAAHLARTISPAAMVPGTVARMPQSRDSSSTNPPGTGGSDAVGRTRGGPADASDAGDAPHSVPSYGGAAAAALPAASTQKPGGLRLPRMSFASRFGRPPSVGAAASALPPLSNPFLPSPPSGGAFAGSVGAAGDAPDPLVRSSGHPAVRGEHEGPAADGGAHGSGSGGAGAAGAGHHTSASAEAVAAAAARASRQLGTFMQKAAVRFAAAANNTLVRKEGLHARNGGGASGSQHHLHGASSFPLDADEFAESGDGAATYGLPPVYTQDSRAVARPEAVSGSAGAGAARSSPAAAGSAGFSPSAAAAASSQARGGTPSDGQARREQGGAPGGAPAAAAGAAPSPRALMSPTTGTHTASEWNARYGPGDTPTGAPELPGGPR